MLRFDPSHPHALTDSRTVLVCNASHMHYHTLTFTERGPLTVLSSPPPPLLRAPARALRLPHTLAASTRNAALPAAAPTARRCTLALGGGALGDPRDELMRCKFCKFCSSR